MHDLGGQADDADSPVDMAYAWRVLTVTSLGTMLQGLNASTLIVALPTVSAHFAATPSEASWFLLSYMLVNTVCILSFGRLADIFSRKRIYILGLGLLTFASLCCGLATSPAMLIMFRALQGIGAAAIISNSVALLTDAFPRRALSVGLGIQLSVSATSQVLGPVLGGALATWLGWRAVFWFNVPVGICGVLWAVLSLRKPARSVRRAEKFDVTSAILSFVTLGSLVMGLVQAGSHGWSSNGAIAGGVVFLITLPGFLFLQSQRKFPLVDIGIFRDLRRSMAYLSAFLVSISRQSVALLVSLYAQAVSGMNAFQAGIRVTPVACGMILAAPIAGRLARNMTPKLLSTSGLVILAVGLILLMLGLEAGPDYGLVAVGLFAVGAGSGSFLIPNTNDIMQGVNADRRGVANALRSMLQNTGTLLSSGLSLAIVTGGLATVEKRAVYAGSLSMFPESSLEQFQSNYRIALGVLLCLCVLAGAASFARGSKSHS
jgi:EmrB/QacA subfamily drug resistance transporter